MKVYVVGEYREQFQSKLNDSIFNPHPSYSQIQDIMLACQNKNISCEYFGGVLELIHAIDTNKKFDIDDLFINISDGLTQSYCRIQAPVLFEILGVRYTGSTPFVVSLICNKYYSKIALRQKLHTDLKYADDIYCCRNSIPLERDIKSIGFPVIIKPNNDGFSMGIDKNSIAHTYFEAVAKIKSLQKEYDEILIEKYIPGIDVSVFIVGNYPNIKINEIIVYKTYDSFFQETTIRGIQEKAHKLSQKFSANKLLSNNIIQQLKETSIQIYKAFNARDIARIDYRLSKPCLIINF